jgi:hypothetical protein
LNRTDYMDLQVVNSVPVLAVISNRVINVGVNLSITNVATDSDTPAQTLTYSLITAVTNAAINANSGVFSWRPLVTQADTTNLFSVVVADNGSPSMIATQSFSVMVNPLTAPSIVAPQVTGGQIGLTINGQVGPDYAVQGSTNLVNWDTLWVTNPAIMPFTWSATNITALTAQFYRIKTGPPLP